MPDLRDILKMAVSDGAICDGVGANFGPFSVLSQFSTILKMLLDQTAHLKTL